MNNLVTVYETPVYWHRARLRTVRVGSQALKNPGFAGRVGAKLKRTDRTETHAWASIMVGPEVLILPTLDIDTSLTDVIY